MNHYLLSICYPAGATEPPAETLERIRRDLAALNQEMQAAGAWVFAAGLQPPDTASVVRLKDGRPLITDGPFIETKEQIGGICVIRAADLYTAHAWGEKLARTVGVPVEVRPMLPHHGTA